MVRVFQVQSSVFDLNCPPGFMRRSLLYRSIPLPIKEVGSIRLLLPVDYLSGDM